MDRMGRMCRIEATLYICLYEAVAVRFEYDDKSEVHDG